MGAVPTIGGSNNTWGTELNAHLLVHASATTGVLHNIIQNSGDTNTYIDLGGTVADEVTILAGGQRLITATETTQNLVEINETAGDCDFIVNSSSNEAITVDGASGHVTLRQGTADPTDHGLTVTGLQTSGHTGYIYSNSSQTGNCLRVLQDGAGSSGSALYIRTDGTGHLIECIDTATPVFIVEQLGAVTMEGILNLNAGRISFPATQNASSSANVLDDYEEGACTLGLTFGGAAVGMTTSATSGYYTKIGNMVHVSGYLSLTAKGSSTGAASITGLPFTVYNSTAAYTGAQVSTSAVSYANQLSAYAEINTTTITLAENTEAGTRTTLNEGNFSDSSWVIVGVSYRVA